MNSGQEDSEGLIYLDNTSMFLKTWSINSNICNLMNFCAIPSGWEGIFNPAEHRQNAGVRIPL